MKNNFLKRKMRVRYKIIGSAKRPRISVYKSNKSIFVQAIDDQKGVTIVSQLEKGLGKDVPKEIGKKIAERLIKKNITLAVFDKGGYKYHGKVKAVSEGLREKGLKV